MAVAVGMRAAGVAGGVLLQLFQQPARNFPPVLRGHLPKRLLNFQNTAHLFNSTKFARFCEKIFYFLARALTEVNEGNEGESGKWKRAESYWMLDAGC
jgi:hypothetical protein